MPPQGDMPRPLKLTEEGGVLPHHCQDVTDAFYHPSSLNLKRKRQSSSSWHAHHHPKSHRSALRIVPLLFVTGISYSFLSWSFFTTASSGLFSADHVHEGEEFLTHYMAVSSSETNQSQQQAQQLQQQQSSHVTKTTSPTTTTNMMLRNDFMLVGNVKGVSSTTIALDALKQSLRQLKHSVRIHDDQTGTVMVQVTREEEKDPWVPARYCVGPQNCKLSLDKAVEQAMKHIASSSRGFLRLEDVVPGSTEYRWWLVDGYPVLVSTSCSTTITKTTNSLPTGGDLYLSTSFQPLLLQDADVTGGCAADAIRPRTWDRMAETAQRLVADSSSTSTGSSIARLTFYTTPSSDDVYVSSMVTSDASHLPKRLHQFLQGASRHVSRAVLEPHHIERIMNEKSWGLVAAFTASTHDDASSVCQHVNADNEGGGTPLCRSEDFVSLEEDYPIKCLAVNQSTKSMTAVGQWRLPTFETVIVRVDWPWALGLTLVLLLLHVSGLEPKLSKKRNAIPLTVMVYLGAVVVNKYLQPSNAGLFSPHNIATTVADSFHAFTVVHPMTSPWIALSHILTYWFEIAAWRSKSIRGVLLWYLAYELGASYINEYMHITEEDTAIRCMRVIFVSDMKQYAVDDVIRAYLLPPFFVYLYLLPKFVLSALSSSSVAGIGVSMVGIHQ